MWSLEARGLRLERRVEVEGLEAVLVLGDGRVAAIDVDRVTTLWSPDLEGVLACVRFACPQVMVSLDDGRVATVRGEVLEIWDPERDADEPRAAIHAGEAIHLLAGLPDNRVITSLADGRIQLWTPWASRRGPV